MEKYYHKNKDVWFFVFGLIIILIVIMNVFVFMAALKTDTMGFFLFLMGLLISVAVVIEIIRTQFNK